MLRMSFAFFLCFISASAALSNDTVAAAELRLIGQERESAIERALSGYFDDDDITGANAFVDKLAADGDISETERRVLEDRIWHTKTERTLRYARKVREAIQNSDLEMMRDYNARIQRLTGSALPNSVVEADSEQREAEAVTSAPDTQSDIVRDEEGAAGVIADLMRRGEEAIASYNLMLAPEGMLSALGVLDQLKTLGGEGETAAKTLGQKIMAVYAALIERDIGRGRLDKARTFAERMRTVAEHAGLPTDEVDSLSARIDEVSSRAEEHDRLLRQAAHLRDQGQLVAPSENHALVFAAKALKLDLDRAVANDMLNDIIKRQRRRADQLAEAGRLRDGAREFEVLADTLLEADIGKEELVASFRSEAAALFRRAGLRDSERERRAAADAPPASEAPAESEGSPNPFTFINPF
ncbi:MAG: hypothetical protein ACR2RF_23705 [Geminicoccaceae bacterium]